MKVSRQYQGNKMKNKNKNKNKKKKKKKEKKKKKKKKKNKKTKEEDYLVTVEGRCFVPVEQTVLIVSRGVFLSPWCCHLPR